MVPKTCRDKSPACNIGGQFRFPDVIVPSRRRSDEMASTDFGCWSLDARRKEVEMARNASCRRRAEIMTPRTQAQAVASPIKTLFVDIGGVLLSDGWGHKSRALAATEFGIAAEELEESHHQAFESFEVGKTDLERYL